ncbi:hypothetical protein [Streptosporangium sp. KLBMP 9127]|nr:hypothetical protein [Streptosporangium sp. KLBMP 9127]
MGTGASGVVGVQRAHSVPPEAIAHEDLYRTLWRSLESAGLGPQTLLHSDSPSAESSAARSIATCRDQ